MYRRKIKDGKLELLCHLVGGPADGMLVDGELREIRIPIRSPLRIAKIPLIMQMPEFKFHRYVKTSDEKYTYFGESS